VSQNEQELLRLRNRFHNEVAPLLAAHTLRIELLDEWRDRIEKRLALLEGTVDRMEKDELMRTVRFTVWQKIVAGVVVIVPLAAGIKSLLPAGHW